MKRLLCSSLFLLAIAGLASAADEALVGSHESITPAAKILAAQGDPLLIQILGEVLSGNPELAALEARTRSIGHRSSQARALPDPRATVTAFLETPETRVGPQRARATLSQNVPWFGKRDLREDAANQNVRKARAELEARELSLVTEARTLYLEISFLDMFAQLTREDRDTLHHFEELARSRYASGVGLQQDVVKIQAEITRDETKLLDVQKRRTRIVSSLNELRGRVEAVALPRLTLPTPSPSNLQLSRLKDMASRRPELTAAAAEIDRTQAMIGLARSSADPDLTFGLTYSLVDDRTDPAGRLNAPEDNGQDVLGLTVGLNLPIWRQRIASGVQEAVERKATSEESRRQVLTHVYQEVEDLYARIPLLWEQLQLFDTVLALQAEEALRSAHSAYSSGSINGLDLLDAERLLLEVRTSTERGRADYAIALARLEGAIAGPLSGEDGWEDTEVNRD